MKEIYKMIFRDCEYAVIPFFEKICNELCFRHMCKIMNHHFQFKRSYNYHIVYEGYFVYHNDDRVLSDNSYSLVYTESILKHFYSYGYYKEMIEMIDIDNKNTSLCFDCFVDDAVRKRKYKFIEKCIHVLNATEGSDQGAETTEESKKDLIKYSFQKCFPTACLVGAVKMVKWLLPFQDPDNIQKMKKKFPHVFKFIKK